MDGASPSLNDVATTTLGKKKDGSLKFEMIHYDGRYPLTKSHINYAVQDAILCLEIEEMLINTPDQISIDAPMIKIGALQVKATQERIDTGDMKNVTWCGWGLHQAISLNCALKKVKQATGKTLYPFDTGSGAGGSNCVASCFAVWDATRKDTIPNVLTHKGVKDPMQYLRDHDYKDVHLLTASTSGTTPSSLARFAQSNDIMVDLFTTDTLSGRYPSKTIIPRKNKRVCILAHHGHAWLLAPEEWKPHPSDISDDTNRQHMATDCHCGQCVYLDDKKHDPLDCFDCRSHGMDNYSWQAEIITERTKLLKQELDRQLMSSWREYKFTVDLGYLRI